MKYFSYSIITIVFATIVVGFFFAESPAQVRLLRLDEQRTNDLVSLQYEIVEYWRTKQKLPVELTDLIDEIRGNTLPIDPVSSQPYQYKAMGDLSFELCATFDLASINDNQGPKAPEVYRETGYNYGNWQHTAGRACFTRTIDPEIYKQVKI